MVFIYLFFPEIKVAILSDSIAKYVTGIRQAEVIAFPGINFSRLTRQIEKNPKLVEKKFTIIHVGTNDIKNYTIEEMLSFFNNLITLIRSMSSTTIVFSSILPRPVDADETGEKVKEVNLRIKQKCKDRNVQFLHSFRPFLKYGKPIRELFAVRDGGLHLNNEGTRLLRSFFINTVSHLIKNM